MPFKAMLTIGEPVASTDGVNIELMVKVTLRSRRLGFAIVFR